MRRLMLLRHAKSDWSAPGKRDHDRVLNPRGREAAPRIGAYMARHALVPDLIVASTATRVVETLELLLPAFEKAPKVVSEPRIYEAEVEHLMEVIREAPQAAHSVLIVGHNPGLGDLASDLIAVGDEDARQRLVEKFPTAGLAVIDFAVDDWEKVHAHGGRLDRFVVPRTLDAETD